MMAGASDEEEQDCKPAAKPRYYRGVKIRHSAGKCAKEAASTTKRSKQNVVLLDGSDREDEVELFVADSNDIVAESVIKASPAYDKVDDERHRQGRTQCLHRRTVCTVQQICCEG